MYYITLLQGECGETRGGERWEGAGVGSLGGGVQGLGQLQTPG